MKLLLLCDSFPPQRSSAAVQLSDLAEQFALDGHALTVIVADPECNEPVSEEWIQNYRLIRIRTPKTKDIGYIRRSMNEFLMPFLMWYRLIRYGFVANSYDAIIWYSPTIFLGPLVQRLKTKWNCTSYLIIRDIFPEWAADIGILKRGLAYKVLKVIANYQYSVADIIGVQSPGNLKYFRHMERDSTATIEVLPNWLKANPRKNVCSIDLSKTKLNGKKVLAYTGNMGIAQDLSLVVDLAKLRRDDADLGFIFVGRGAQKEKLISEVKSHGLNNFLFFDEIDPSEIPGLLSQCAVGIVSLDYRHKSHNIPGKFITYLQNSLPCFAIVNPGNDITRIIEAEQLGRCCETRSLTEISKALDETISLLDDGNLKARCKLSFDKYFSVVNISKMLTESLYQKKIRR